MISEYICSVYFGKFIKVNEISYMSVVRWLVSVVAVILYSFGDPVLLPMNPYRTVGPQIISYETILHHLIKLRFVSSCRV